MFALCRTPQRTKTPHLQKIITIYCNSYEKLYYICITPQAASFFPIGTKTKMKASELFKKKTKTSTKQVNVDLKRTKTNAEMCAQFGKYLYQIDNNIEKFIHGFTHEYGEITTHDWNKLIHGITMMLQLKLGKYAIFNLAVEKQLELIQNFTITFKYLMEEEILFEINHILGGIEIGKTK